jgi:uncharacterized membrane protein YbaN (DUF454 family)
LKIWTLIGLLLLILAAIGVVLPLLPTTPFVLLAAACFAKSSPRLHQWLMDSEVFGPMLLDWQKKRCVTRKVKAVSLTMMLGVGGSSIWFFTPPGWPTAGAAAMVMLGALTVLSLNTCSQCQESQD